MGAAWIYYGSVTCDNFDLLDLSISLSFSFPPVSLSLSLSLKFIKFIILSDTHVAYTYVARKIASEIKVGGSRSKFESRAMLEDSMNSIEWNVILPDNQRPSLTCTRSR